MRLVETRQISVQAPRLSEANDMSEQLLTRLQNSHPRLGNSALARPLSPIERAQMVAVAADKIAELLSVLQVDHKSDHNTRGTPERVARMLVNEVMKGRFVSPPELTEFANATGSKELIVTGPIEVRSTCAHHLMPIYGNAYIGVLPSEAGEVIGLSKYDRVVEHFSLRLQIQEELTHQIGQYLMQHTRPAGLAVRISAVHMCKTHRGVRASHNSRMVTSKYFGVLSQRPEMRAEFLQECALLERSAL
jgi:GTP cyclohydrolase I